LDIREIQMKLRIGRRRNNSFEAFASEGVHHVTIPGVMRIHMRREKNGNNIVWVNGIDMLIVNKVAADFIDVFINKVWESNSLGAASPEMIEKAVVKDMKKIYPGTPEDRLAKDFNMVYGTLQSIAGGACPIHNLKLGVREISPTNWIAPPRIDLAVTYRCDNNCYFCYAGVSRSLKELNTDQWKKAIDLLWKIGIPQIVFTGGEATCRKDLVELVRYAQQFVTGLITNGRRLSESAEDLRDASLDYVQVSLESHEEIIHDKMVGADGAWKETVQGIKKALTLRMDVVTNTTLTKENYKQFPALIRFGKELGLKTMACNTLICSGKGSKAIQTQGLDEAKLKEVLLEAQQVAKETGIDLKWYSPTCYKRLNPIELGLGIKACSAAQYNMTVEPDGRVIPCQSWIHEGVGNILTDSWENIWQHPTCVALRKGKYAEGNEECINCQHLPACGGGCPLEKLGLPQ
jgi:radical SAM protein with 4Fe4S-binding SPASM domain